MTVKELLDRLLASLLDQAREGERSLRTHEQYEWLARDYIVPEIGGLAIGRVTGERCKDVLRRVREAGKSDQTRAHVYTVMHRAFAYAIGEGWLTVHPMARIKKPRAAEYQAKVLSVEEARRFLAAAENEPYFGTALTTCLALGMRLGEVLGLRKRHLDKDRQKLRICGQVQRLQIALRPKTDHHGLVVIERPKSDSGGEPDLPGVAWDRLRAHAVKQAERQLKAGNAWQATVTVMVGGKYGRFEEQPNDLLFTTEDGRPLDGKVVRDAFVRVCREAGIPHSARGQRGLRVHDLRGSAATLLIEDGASAREVMDLCRWKSPQMFLHYTKVQEQARAKTASRMDKLLTSAI